MKHKGNNHCDGCGGSVRALAASAGIQFGDLQTEAYRLREKLGKAGEVVETVRGFGYRVRDK